jgi:hypothetical protein
MWVRIQLLWLVAVWMGEWFQTFQKNVMRSCSSETLETTRPVTERHIPDDLNHFIAPFYYTISPLQNYKYNLRSLT